MRSRRNWNHGACDPKKKNVLVLGIGNISRKDDGIGVHVVNRIIESGFEIPGDVEIIDGGTAGYDLLSLMIDRSRIIIVDALRAEDVPGSVYRIPGSGVKRRRHGYPFQVFCVEDLLLMLRLMGSEPEVEIIGIVPEDIDSVEIGCSESLKRAMPKIINEVMNAARGRTEMREPSHVE
jgi:hydrogenase maturation protease